MILNDQHIRDRVASDDLISPFEEGNLKNCRYYVTAGRCFLPETGHEPEKEPWVLRPNETFVIMTRERVKIPSGLCATFSPINRLAQQGILLINGSLVDPGHDAPLGCFIVNFSQQKVRLRCGDHIAKLHFHKLSDEPTDFEHWYQGTDGYAGDLSKAAVSFAKTFLSIEDLQEKAAVAAHNRVRTSLAIGGGAIVVLAFFSTLAPLFQRYIVGEVPAAQKNVQVLQDKLDQLLSRIRVLENK